MNDPCSTELLEQALAGRLDAEHESSLEHHLETCDQCSAALEQLAGGNAWRQEVAALLTQDELDVAACADAAPACDEWSAIDFTVEHLEPAADANVLGRLGGYDVLEIIGRGGMGVVLKGFDRELKRCVAIKVLAPHLAMSALAKKRFAREAQAAAAVVHPNVLAIHQVQAGGRLPFIVMPLVAGESLAERLVAQGRLELKETLRIGMQAAAGLAAAHEQGLVHRDVKPANILLEKGVERAVLTDFGLARAADDATLTRWGVIAGTPQYMSPEQARGEQLDGRSDLFSLGCVLYEAATGVSPFRADSMMATLRRLVDEPPQALAALNAELPPWFAAIVERLLEKDPARRFASALEVSELLEQCLAHVQQPAVAPLPARLLARQAGGRKKPPMMKWAAAGFAFLFIALAVVIVVDWKKGTVTISTDGDVAVVDASPKGGAKAKGKRKPATDDPGGKTLDEFGGAAVPEPTELSFGAVTYRAVNDDDPTSGNFCIDLESGKLLTPPTDLHPSKTPKEFDRWLADHSVDVVAETKNDVHSLIGFDMIATPVAFEQWECEPTFVLKELASGKPGLPAVMSAPDRRAATFVIQTREGRQGVLQIVHYIGKTPRVAIRYKLLEPVSAPEGKALDEFGGDAVPEPTELSFGPVRKRIVNDDMVEAGSFLIDLDSGTVTSPPTDLDGGDKPAAMAWFAANGVDAIGQLHGAHGLLGFDMIVVPTANNQWDCSPASLLEELEKGTAGSSSPMSGRGELPVTYLIQTREGGQGVLQIVGLSDDDPRAVRIRYKLLESPGDPGGKTLKGAGGEKRKKAGAILKAKTRATDQQEGELNVGVTFDVRQARVKSRASLTVSVVNTSTVDDNDVELSLLLPPQMAADVASINLPPNIQVSKEGDQLRFTPVAALRPNERVVYSVPLTIKGPAGVAAVSTIVRSRNATEKLIRQDSLEIVE